LGLTEFFVLNSLIKNIYFSLAGLVLIFVISPVWALDSLSFQDAYGLGMGGADVAIVGGTHAVEVNPAGLGRTSVPMAQIGLGLISPSGTFDLDNVLVYPLEDGTVFALSQFSGFYNGYSDTEIIGSAALPLDFFHNLFMGFNLKYLLLSNPTNSIEGAGQGLGLDFGLNYDLRGAGGTLASFGLAIKDLSSQVRFSNTGEESVTRTFVLGAAYDDIKDTRIEMDYDIVDQTLGTSSQHNQLRLGAERFFQDRNFSVRLGYDDLFQSDGAFSLGAGYYPNQPFEITYALQITNDFSQISNFFNFVYKFDDLIKSNPEKAGSNAEINLNGSTELEEAATPITVSHDEKQVSGIPVRKIEVNAVPSVLSLSGTQKTIDILFSGEKENDVTSWELLIQDPQGKVLRRIDGTGNPFSALGWDGTDDGGKQLSEGQYKVILRTFDEKNNILSDDFTTVQIVSARTHFGLNIDNPYISMAKNKKPSFLIFTPVTGDSYDVATWSFKVTNQQTQQIVYERKGKLHLPKTIKWNGLDSKGAISDDGIYGCVLEAQDKIGNLLTSDLVKVFIQSTPPALTLKGESNWVDFTPKSNFKFQLNAIDPAGFKNWTLNLLDENDNVVKSFSGDGIPPGQLTWDGQTDAKVSISPGAFLIGQLSVTDNAGNIAQADDFPIQVELGSLSAQETLSLNLTTVYFDDGSDSLTFDGKKELQQAAISIKPYLDKSTLVIKGYAAGSETGDLVSLSHDRAKTVKEFMMKTFNVAPDKISALGYSTRDVLKTSSGDEPVEKQRRATVILYTQP
jgi:outer membrane protein OmpA-like peptidoglycan-associated protein